MNQRNIRFIREDYLNCNLQKNVLSLQKIKHFFYDTPRATAFQLVLFAFSIGFVQLLHLFCSPLPSVLQYF